MKQRIISMILCLALLVGLMPSISAAATEPKNGTKTTMVGTNSVGTMIADELKNVEQDAGDPNVLQDLTIENGTATVRFTTTEEAELVVAIYEEASGRQVTSAKATVHKDDTTAALALDASALPQYFRAEAFLLSAEDYTPLCESLSTPMYTQAFQELLQKSADDFDSDRVLNLDEDKTTNFAVYGDDVKRSESDETVNTVQSADDEALRYVIDNPDSTVTSLQPGDFWSCEGAEEILIVKVKNVTVQGNQAIITGQDTSMEEVFDYAKIEGDATAEDAVVDASQMADGVTYNGVVDMEQETRAVSGEGSLKRGWSFSLNKEIEGDEASAKLSLSLALSVTTKLTYYIAKSDSYISFTQDYKMSVKGELENKLTLYEIPLTLVPIVIPICGVINIEVEPNLVAEFSATVSIDTSLTWTTSLTYEQGKGFRNASSKPTTSAEFSIEGTLFIGASVKIKFCVISSYICSIGVSFQAGAEVNAKLTGREREDGKIHACDGCLDGSIHIVFKLKASAELFKIFKISKTLAEFKLLLGEFYNSLTYHESGWGDCPHWYAEGSEPEKPTEPSEVIASGTCGENLTWTLDGNCVLTISGTGAMYDYSHKDYAPWHSQGYRAKVKKAIINEGVTNIGNYAFAYCSGLTSIMIPSSVTSIGNGAFSYCSGLTSITIPSSVTNIGDGAFADCSGLTGIWVDSNSTAYASDNNGVLFNKNKTSLICCPAGYSGAYTISSSVTSIGNYAFYGCSGLTNITIPSSVTSIGDNAFTYCSGLVSITIPSSVTNIGVWAFGHCSGLTSVKIPLSVTNIGAYAFDSCSSLTSITIPSSVTSIGDYVFSCCYGLTSITIPSSVTSIGSYAFWGCSGLTSVTIPSSVTSIGDYVFSRCSGLTSIYFCGNVPNISDSAFDYVVATAYYPAGNSTWTDGVKQNYGGKLTWTPWTPTDGAAAAHEVRGLHTGRTDGGTVSFSDLTPGAQYVLIVSRDKNSDLLASGNLLFIAQAATDADGTLTFTPAPQEAVANAFVGLFGQGETISGGYEPCDGVNCPGKAFADMPAKGNWAHDPIDWAVSNEITNGTSASTFSPGEGCTRAQVVTFLWRAAGQPVLASSTNPFTDVKPGAYYYNAVLWAVEKGITNGTSDKTFSPDETCTRAQIVTFLWRYEGQPAPTSTDNPFADVRTSAYFGSAVLWAVEKGITNGTSATTFDPEDTCTRAQVVTFLYRDVLK